MPRRILLADDHDGWRLRLLTLLESAGFEVCGEAINGSDAIAKTKALLPDLIILDISMPVINGIDAIPGIVQSAPGIKIVVFSVHEDDELRREALRRGRMVMCANLVLRISSMKSPNSWAAIKSKNCCCE
jgi:DNA-binding NarL/FixJ family response regulator